MSETLTEFLLARIAEDAHKRAAAAAHDHLLWTQVAHFDESVRALGWVCATTSPLSWLGFGWLARVKASEYANHPDYREEWKP